MWRKIKLALGGTVSAVTAGLGLVGIFAWCCTLTGAAILSALGLASLSGFLAYNSKWLFVASAVFLILTIVYYIQFKRSKVCKTDIKLASGSKYKGQNRSKDKDKKSH